MGSEGPAPRIAILGAGLTGLLAAHGLKKVRPIRMGGSSPELVVPSSRVR